MNAAKPKAQPSNETEDELQAEQRHCGIIMPIAPMVGYDPTHWGRVREVLGEAISEAGYVPRMVSEREDIGVIHARIVENIYEDEIVVCDVSGKNANVMFEFGMRLAFDKPVIVVKDDKTDYSFDTSPIEHIGYRSDLRFDDVREFKARIKKAILATVTKAKEDDSFSPFLKHFTKITAKSLDVKEVPEAEYIAARLEGIERRLDRIANRVLPQTPMSNKLLESVKNHTYHFDRLDEEWAKLMVAVEIGKMSKFRPEELSSEEVMKIANLLAKQLSVHAPSMSDERLRELALETMIEVYSGQEEGRDKSADQ